MKFFCHTLYLGIADIDSIKKCKQEQDEKRWNNVTIHFPEEFLLGDRVYCFM